MDFMHKKLVASDVTDYKALAIQLLERLWYGIALK